MSCGTYTTRKGQDGREGGKLGLVLDATLLGVDVDHHLVELIKGIYKILVVGVLGIRVSNDFLYHRTNE